jgi:cell division protein FtsQ
LQQVGREEFIASAEPVDPRKLPAHLSTPARKARVAARHTWILHRPRVLRGIALAIVVVGLALAWEGREEVALGVQQAGDALQGRLADAGFAIKAISISGQALTSDADIFKALAIAPRTSTFAFDADAARARIAELPAISSVTVRKVYPGHVDVIVTEKHPVARWRVDGVTFLIDAQGEQIAVDSGAYAELPLIVGDGAADDALAMVRAIDRYPALKSGLATFSRIADRRWDLIYYTGLRVQLPEQGVGVALAALETYQDQYQLLDRDVTKIDMRVAGFVSLKPGEVMAKYLTDLAKRNKKQLGGAKHAVDPAYETPAEKHGD